MSNLTIRIEFIPHAEQRVSGVGDWFLDGEGTLHIRVSQMADIKHMWLVALHELVEVVVEGMKYGEFRPPSWLIAQTDTFDEHFSKQRHKGDASEPGYDPAAPYYQSHMIACAVEHLAAMLLAVNYNDYEAALDAL